MGAEVLINYLLSQYQTIIAAGDTVGHVIVIDMQNESDSGNPSIGSQAGLNDWVTGVYDRRSAIAGVFGLPDSSVPLLFIHVPYNYQASTYPTSSETSGISGNSDGFTSGGLELFGSGNPDQNYVARLAEAEQSLVDDTRNNMYFAVNFGDASVAGDGGTVTYVPANGTPGTYFFGGDHYYVGGGFLDPIVTTNNGVTQTTYAYVANDFQTHGPQADFITRLANSIADVLAPQLGISQHFDAGPIAMSATIDQNSPNGNQVVVAFTMDPSAGSFMMLGSVAALGAGWTVGSATSVQGYAVGATVIDASHIELTFNEPVSSNENLFYQGIGDGQITLADFYDHIVDPANNPGWTKWNGQGAAIYDSSGLPIQDSAYGLPLTGQLSDYTRAYPQTSQTSPKELFTDTEDTAAKISPDTLRLTLPADFDWRVRGSSQKDGAEHLQRGDLEGSAGSLLSDVARKSELFRFPNFFSADRDPVRAKPEWDRISQSASGLGLVGTGQHDIRALGIPAIGDDRAPHRDK